VVIRAGANSRELAELSSAQESRERLYVAAKAMIVRDQHLTARTRRRVHDALHSFGRERERALHQHVDAGRDRTQHMRLVQVIRRSDDDGPQLIRLEEILDVRVDVGNVEAIGE
jgi:hypothetical protein